MKLFYINSIWRALRALIAWPILCIGLFFLSALIGSSIPANSNWVQPREGIDIYVETNGVHVSLIVPIIQSGEDLSDLIRPEHLIDRDLYGTHVMIGWGHGGVYRNAKTWSDVQGSDVLGATLGSGDTILHIYHLINPEPTLYRKRIRVNEKQYRLIIKQIRAAFRLDQNGQSMAQPAYGPSNLFYNSHGRYSAIHTCNNWTGEVLKNAGIKIGVWTPMAGGVMKWF